MDLQTRLYEKAKSEMDTFIEELKHKPPDKIIEASYEKVIRDDILMIFENEELPKNQVKELLKLKYPLSECYNRWLKADCSHMEMLQDTIEDFAGDLVKHSEEKKKAARKYEQER